MAPLLLRMLRAGSCNRFLHSQLTSALLGFVVAFASDTGAAINQTKFSDADYCKVVAGQVLVALAHLRALQRRTYRYEQCCKHLLSLIHI
eukprot:2209399-Alexandrium_andersonii.AAC.1